MVGGFILSRFFRRVDEPGLARAQPSSSTTAGLASWYGPGYAGRLTANGETFDPNGLTAASRTLKFGTRVLVRNVENGTSVTVRVNDRGPFAKRGDGSYSRIIDLSEGAARIVGMIDRGVVPVELTIL